MQLPPDLTRIELRWPAKCRQCVTVLDPGTAVWHSEQMRSVWCRSCGPDMAGTSARREYDRRRITDAKRLREHWGPLGGMAVALTPERESTRAWAKGAIGEERLGLRLDRLRANGLAVLHDRRIPGHVTNIDHMVVTTSGVWVIDAKRYKGRPERRVTGGVLGPRHEHLVVAGRDRDRLVAGVHKQVASVRAAVPGVPVVAVLCFIEAEWPLLSSGFSVEGVLVVPPRRLTRVLAKTSDMGIEIGRVADHLGTRFPRA